MCASKSASKTASLIHPALARRPWDRRVIHSLHHHAPLSFKATEVLMLGRLEGSSRHRPPSVVRSRCAPAVALLQQRAALEATGRHVAAPPPLVHHPAAAAGAGCTVFGRIFERLILHLGDAHDGV
jgi:hypothetical protein